MPEITETAPPVFISPAIDRWREQIFGAIDDLVSDFLYYDRREDEDLPLGKIEELAGCPRWLTIGEMAAFFEGRLRERIPVPPEILEGEIVEFGNPDQAPAG